MHFDLEEARAQLARTPMVLDALASHLPDAWLQATDGPGTWSPAQVLRHLIWCEVDDWIPRARTILEQGAAVPFRPFDREGGESRYARLTVSQLLGEFARLRAENLRTLDGFGLDAGKLRLEGLHPELGRVTLDQLLSTWVAHDLSHLTQITRTLARQFRHAVGPWRQYMRVLQAD